MGKRLIVTNNGLLGTAPREARKGDLVCVLLGCGIPLVLRSVNQEKGTFELVGECYIDGYMRGEVLVDLLYGGYKMKDILLI
ncbi:uncharacterized protein K444DRAFT_610698 [Hyaloscypha bicolor E]|uniref:Uncharacterized protein n=1 Tax=Hyaloscypha bicolor E TaxID=1095630 RepID=A0A2J6TI13_9HELO|nr:uncharacterized protein K444DRAFT_610698 [Hyaloscypha bicolor E]PMD62665.1 hypothetical protein K444DRAFT_610698 [Hyaloscypha bicolor E]